VSFVGQSSFKNFFGGIFHFFFQFPKNFFLTPVFAF